MRLARKVAAVSLLVCAFAHPGPAQTIAAHGSAGPARLDGPWLVYEGDPSGGSLASTDPRVGRTVSLSLNEASAQTAAQAAKIIWLRATVMPDEPVPDVALAVNLAANDCKVFVNGREAGDCARWPRTTIEARRWMFVHVPNGPVQIAIRLVGPSGGAAILPRSGEVLFGRAPVLRAIRTAADAERFYLGLPQTLLCLGELLGGVILLLVFRYDRRRREYLWFAAFLFLDGTMSLLSVFGDVYPLLPQRSLVLTNALGMMGRYAPLVGFIAAFTAVRLNRWMRGYQILLLVAPLLVGLAAIFAEGTWLADLANQLAYQDFAWILVIVELPFVVGSVGFLGWKWRKGNREAGLLLLPFLLASGIEMLGLTVPWFRQFRVGRFGFDFDDLSMFFFLISIGPVLLFRHRGITLQHARATAELEAAREIQQRLVPRSIPVFPGYQMEAAFLPAEEVGGDFYQILPQRDGSVVLAIGDVSGKGLKAAMTGVLAIGALRTLAAEGLGPAALLMRLNSQMVHAGSGGFITCFCAVLDPNGHLLLANAGHLAPYLNGREIQLPGTLPLGLDPGAEYEETTLALDPGDRLTMLSDGVVEAQSATGELFGFERTCAISVQTAQRIAEEARRFGQADDITVLTLHQLAVGSLSVA